jgi:hypothetical protein
LPEIGGGREMQNVLYTVELINLLANNIFLIAIRERK